MSVFVGCCKWIFRAFRSLSVSKLENCFLSMLRLWLSTIEFCMYESQPFAFVSDRIDLFYIFLFVYVLFPSKNCFHFNLIEPKIYESYTTIR